MSDLPQENNTPTANGMNSGIPQSALDTLTPQSVEPEPLPDLFSSASLAPVMPVTESTPASPSVEVSIAAAPMAPVTEQPVVIPPVPATPVAAEPPLPAAPVADAGRTVTVTVTIPPESAPAATTPAPVIPSAVSDATVTAVVTPAPESVAPVVATPIGVPTPAPAPVVSSPEMLSGKTMASPAVTESQSTSIPATPSTPDAVIPVPVKPAKRSFWSFFSKTKSVHLDKQSPVSIPAAVLPATLVAIPAAAIAAEEATQAASSVAVVVQKPKTSLWSKLSRPRSITTKKEPIAASPQTGGPANPTLVVPKKSLWSFFSKHSSAAPKKEADVVVPAPVSPAIVPETPVSTPASEVQNSAPTSTLASFAANNPEPAKGKIISAADLQKEEREKQEQAHRSSEEAKKEMQQAQDAKKKGKPAEPAIPKKLLPKKPAGGLEKFLASLSHFGMGKERMQFTANLATMLGAGLPLVDSLQTLRTETKHKGFKQVVRRIVDLVENGSPLWRAMDSENLFSLHAIALIRIGEEAGNLAKNMEYLALQENKDHELVQKVKMAMIYPIIVLSIMFVVVMGLGMFVLPNLIGVLQSLNVKLPLVTRMVIGFSNAFTNYGLIIVPGTLTFIVVFIILAKFTPMKVPVQWVLFRIPGIGALLRDATIARFGVIMGGLLQAGVPVLDAAQSLVQVTSILVYKHFYQKLREHITVGDSFAKSFLAIKGSEKLLPPSVQQLVITGEKSGALSLIMLKIADIYDKKASETAQKLPVILEPILLLVIGVLVGTIAIAIIVPIYSIVGNVGRS